jgi:hypothetical protein
MALTKATHRMTSGSIVSVLDFGAVGDGVADDTVAIQAAIDSLPITGTVRGGVVRIPAGIYYVSDRIEVREYITVVGDGGSTSIIKHYANTDCFYATTNVTNSNIGIKGLQIHDQYVGRTQGHGIYFNTGVNGVSFDIEDVYVLVFHDGIHILNPGYSSIKGWVRVTSPIRDGIVINGVAGGVNVQLENTHVLAAGRYNYNLESLSFVGLCGCMSDSATSHGYYLLDCNNVVFDNTTSEDNAGHGYFISGGFNYTFNSPSASKASTVDGIHLEGVYYTTINSPYTSSGSGYGISATERVSPYRALLSVVVNNLYSTDMALGMVYDPDGQVFWRAGKFERIGITGFYSPTIDHTETGNVGTGEDTLTTVTIPAMTLSPTNKIMRIRITGRTAANADNKTVKLKFAGTTILSSGALALNGKEWFIDATLTRYGSAITKAVVLFQTNDTSIPTIYDFTKVTGLDFDANDYDVVVTGEATSDDDIIQAESIISFE